ncbi:hypothetical protein EHS25_008513 [Saitozyma podzolica]|uniref:F-box domain-containing protein n=1 Tax=Saitozyma podzolica TaxID=1890683 RepID=A0A427YM34_9TREE|nr:hypothetical protein EHS25_008513 [Saitozyma podzolica]
MSTTGTTLAARTIHSLHATPGMRLLAEPDIVAGIVEYSDTPTRARCLRVSRAFRRPAIRHLYHTVTYQPVRPGYRWRERRPEEDRPSRLPPLATLCDEALQSIRVLSVSQDHWSDHEECWKVARAARKMTRLRTAWVGTWWWFSDYGRSVVRGDAPCPLWRTTRPPTIVIDTDDPLNTRLWRDYISSFPAQVTTIGIVWDPPDDAGPHHTELGIPLDPKGDTRFGTPESSDAIPPPRQLNLSVSVQRVVIVLKPGPGLEH